MSIIFLPRLSCLVLYLAGFGHSKISKQLSISTTQRFASLFLYLTLQLIPLSKVTNYITEIRTDLWLHWLPWSQSSRLKTSVTENGMAVELQKFTISLRHLILWPWKAKKTHCSQQQQEFPGLLKFFLGIKIVTAFLSIPRFTSELLVFWSCTCFFWYGKWLEVNRNQRKINAFQFILK